MTKEDIIEAVEQSKETALHYLSMDKRVFYNIRVSGKFGSRDYSGDNKDDKVLEKFCNHLDSAIASKGVSTVQITLKDNRGEIDANIPAIILQQEIIKQDEQQDPQKKQNMALNSDFMNMLGMAFGFKGLGDANDQFGTSGVLLAAHKQTMERDFAQRIQDKEMGELNQKVTYLTSKVAQLEEESKALRLENDRLKHQMLDYRDVKRELKELKTSQGKIASVGSMMLSGVAQTFIQTNPVLKGLFGADIQPQIPNAGNNEEEEEEVDVEPEQPQQEVSQPQQQYQNSDPLMTV